MAFRDLIGHKPQILLLQRRLKAGQLAHAHLFSGPAGVGKETAARTLAKILNCEAQKEDACESCAACARIESETFPDFSVIRPSGASRTIKIEEIRELQKRLSFSRFEGKAKVAIFSDAECLNPEASNALLKILEEPSPHTYFFLITSNPEGLLSTIRSRCQGVSFSALPPQEAARLREKKGIAEDPAHKERREKWIQFLLAEKATADGALKLAEFLAKAAEEDKSQLEETLQLGLTVCRDLLAAKSGAPKSALLNPSLEAGLLKKAPSVIAGDLLQKIKLIERLRLALHRHIPAKFALDALCLSMAGKIRLRGAP